MVYVRNMTAICAIYTVYAIFYACTFFFFFLKKMQINKNSKNLNFETRYFIITTVECKNKKED